LWDIVGDDFSLNDNEILEIASLSLDEPELKVVFSNEDDIYIYILSCLGRICVCGLDRSFEGNIRI